MSAPQPPVFSRVWRACDRCRKRKIKCDGKEPCGGCTIKRLPCEFPAANDNAALNRQQMPAFEARCQHVDVLCEKVESLLQRLAGLAELTDQRGQNQAPQRLDSFASPLMEQSHDTGTMDVPMAGSESPADSDASDESSDFTVLSTQDDDHLAIDSYGKFRYVGGAANKLLIDAVKIAATPDTAQSQLTHATPSHMSEKVTVEPLPFFTPGIVWPKLPYLPTPSQVSKPPKYIADALVNAFFDQQNHIFPILYRPSFMRQYHNMIDSSADVETSAEFLSVFFAVCAFSSSLIGQVHGPRFSGIEFYEKATVLHYASTGKCSMEQVQSLALLSLCAARWNTLSQSWKLAGQAVRAAQDLGLHVGFCLPDDSLTEMVAREQARRTWWTVATLDCVVSLALGRPMIGLDDSNCCPLFMGYSDEQLETCATGFDNDTSASPAAPLSGFTAFARLCSIFARIHNLRQREKHITHGQSNPQSKLHKVKGRLQRELSEWKASLPDSVAFQPDKAAFHSVSPANQTMRVVISIMHAAAAMHLHESLQELTDQGGIDDGVGSINELSIQSAQNCICAGELLHNHVPPSHYLAFCIHQITLSGLLLLRSASSTPLQQGAFDSATRCVKLLATLEVVWPPAQRNGAIMKHLLDRRSEGHEMEGSFNILNYSYDLLDPFSGSNPLPFDTGAASFLNAGFT